MHEILSEDWTTVAILAIPHFLYAFIWYFPHLWMKAFGKHSIQCFESIAWILKGLQFSTFALWFLTRTPEGINVHAIEWYRWVISVSLGIAGQALNTGIYNAIGHAGVYYGFKLGKKVPWVTGFPFNVVSHPQYVGSVLTVWAMAILLGSQGVPQLYLLSGYWTGLYVLTGWMENGS